VRSVRAAVHLVLPVLALAALGVLSALQGATTSPSVFALASQGGGTVAAPDTGRIITDGHPTLITVAPRQLPAPPPAPKLPPAPVLRPTTHEATRSAPRAATKPRQVASTAPSAVPASTTTTTTSDAYPYRTDTTGGVDPWGFTKRQCVSYVAWRLSEVGRPISNAAQGWGSALDWDDTARRLGYTVTTKPRVGAVAQWNAGERTAYWSPGSTSSNGTYQAGPVGHVAWVTAVYSDGSVLVAQYNGTGDRTYSTMRVKAPRFLYL
jgi:surface antigen